MKRTVLVSWTCLTAMAIASALAERSSSAAPASYRNMEVLGEVAIEGGELVARGRSATLVLREPAATKAFEWLVEFTPAPKGAPVIISVVPSDPASLARRALGQMAIGRDKDGCALSIGTSSFDETTEKWVSNRDAMPMTWWPAANVKDREELMAGSGLAPQTWHGRRLRLRVNVDRASMAFWLEGRFVRRFQLPPDTRPVLALQLAPDDRLAGITANPRTADPLFLPIDLSLYANDRFPQPFDKPAMRVGRVPFELLPSDRNQLNLRQACWIEAERDPGSYYERYDGGPPVLNDPRMTLLRVPSADYVAAHVLAVCDDNPELTSTLSLRAGRYGFAGQVVQYDFFGEVPRQSQEKVHGGVAPVETPAGRLFAVRVPMDAAFAQDVHGYMDIELTKEIRLARRRPDPARFRYRPLGTASGVRIAGITLERSPLAMSVGSRESGNAFVEPQAPEFQVRLENITAAAQAYRLALTATHRDAKPVTVTADGRVEPGQAAEVALPVPVSMRGYYDAAVTLSDGARRKLLTRQTSFALLPPDTRKHRAQSPFGTWDFSGGHFSCSDADRVGPLYVKLGLRYGMFGFTPEERRKYGVLPGNEPQIVPDGAKAFAKILEKRTDATPLALLFHEHGVSGRHITRVPDLFRDGAPFRMNEDEQKRFQNMFDQAVAAARSMREKYPHVQLSLGNGALPTKEEFYRHKFPAELFDSGGNEAGSFGRPPETQPPDPVANNATLWMDRQLLDAYGYRDKPVTQCYEVCYPSTNPGNLGLTTQADYFVRHALHALAWGLPRFRLGVITDMGNSYRFSNWGAPGFCRMMPEINVKPSFVAFATMTLVLDGAKFRRALPTGSPSVYALELARPDGSAAFAIWTLRGRRPLDFTCEPAEGWTLVDDQANESKPDAEQGLIRVVATPTPVYLVGRGQATAVKAAAPTYTDQPDGKGSLLDRLDRLDDWTMETDRDAELEYYNTMTPRRKGDFRFEPVAEHAGRKGVLRIAPQPIRHGKDTMPMYAVLRHRQGITLPGTPTEIGAWVHGNSGWGRLLYELVDASGQRWISLGAQQAKEGNVWLEDAIPKDMLAKFPTPGISDWNTEDPWGLGRINFDGWRWVALPLPGNYPGEAFPWPSGSQWRWDKDGKVHYPLKLTRLIVELPEKVLYLTEFTPVTQPEIYLSELSLGEGDTVRLKTGARE